MRGNSFWFLGKIVNFVTLPYSSIHHRNSHSITHGCVSCRGLANGWICNECTIQKCWRITTKYRSKFVRHTILFYIQTCHTHTYTQIYIKNTYFSFFRIYLCPAIFYIFFMKNFTSFLFEITRVKFQEFFRENFFLNAMYFYIFAIVFLQRKQQCKFFFVCNAFSNNIGFSIRLHLFLSCKFFLINLILKRKLLSLQYLQFYWLYKKGAQWKFKKWQSFQIPINFVHILLFKYFLNLNFSFLFRWRAKAASKIQRQFNSSIPNRFNLKNYLIILLYL